MSVPVDQIVTAIEDLLQANRETRATLEATDVVLGHGLDALDSGEDLVSILATIPVAAYRQATQDNSDRLNLARHRLRVLVIAACAESGMTPREIAGDWGISRQRVDQFLQEYRRSQDG